MPRVAGFPTQMRGTLTAAAYIWVALGGAVGSVMRFGIGGLVDRTWGESFPYGTLVVNVAGSFLIGFAGGALAGPGGRLSPQARLAAMQFLVTGVCGGFTTFSTFSLQTFELLRHGAWVSAGANAVCSVALCLAATWLGFLLGAALNPAKGN